MSDILSEKMDPWPRFLVRKLNPDIRAALEADAETTGLPIQEIVRRVLCEHYDLNCSPIQGRQREEIWTNALTILVRMPHELFQAIQEDAEETGEYRQRLVHQALEAHYQSAVT